MSIEPRVTFLTQWYPPEPALMPAWMVEALHGAGFRTLVVTGAPHYPTGTVVEGYSPFRLSTEVVGGTRVRRVPEFPSHDSSALRRIATFTSFAVSSTVLTGDVISRGDVTLVYASPATAAVAAMSGRWRRGTPYVLLIQDLWPDSIFATGFLTSSHVRRMAERTVGAFVDASYRQAAHICVISPGMRRLLVERGVPDDKVTLVYNWVDEEIMRPRSGDGRLRNTLKIPDAAFVALYAGNAGEAQGLSGWIEAMQKVADLADVHLVFVGGGTQIPALRSAVRARGLDHVVHFLNAVPSHEVATLVADADVSVVSLADRGLFAVTMPSKLQASLAMASPVIASCAGDVADVVRESGGGWVAQPEDPTSIASAIREAYHAGAHERRSRGVQGRRYYQATMSREIGTQKLIRVLRDAVHPRGNSHLARGQN